MPSLKSERRIIMKQFTTSMMCANMMDLQSQLDIIEEHTDLYHLDIMDGHFVPNITLGFDFIKQLRNRTNKPLDAHLMVEDPTTYFDLLFNIGVDYISMHPKTIERSVFRIIKLLKEQNIKFGIVISPSESFDSIKYYKEYIDKITIMTVEPGFAGQKVVQEAIDKIKEAKDYREKHNLHYLIEVDGSNNYSTFETYKKNGTDIFVLGSTLFKEKDLAKSYQAIKKFVEEA